MSIKERTILIVDDNKTTLKLLNTVLQKNGYDTRKARNGSEAIEKLYSSNRTIQVILLDVVMPGLDGTVVARLIKQTERFKDIQIIMQTAMTSEEDIIKGVDAGADQYLTKPYDNKLLLSMIESCLKNYDALHSAKSQISSLEVKVKSLNSFLKIIEEQSNDSSPFTLLSRLRVHMRDLMAISGDPEIRLSKEDDIVGIKTIGESVVICYPPFAVVLDSSVTVEQQNNVIYMLNIMSKHLQFKIQEGAKIRLQQQLNTTIDTAGHYTLDLVKEIDEAGDEMSKEQILQKMKVNLLEILVAAGHDHLKKDLERLKSGAKTGDVKAQDQTNVDDLLSQFGL